MAISKKDKVLKRNHRMTVRFSDVEMELIQGYAKDMKLSPAECVRKRALHTKVTVHFDVETALDSIKPLTEEFHKIGINLNQLAHHLNGGGIMTDTIMIEIEDYLNDLRILRDKVLETAGRI